MFSINRRRSPWGSQNHPRSSGVGLILVRGRLGACENDWVAVKELRLSYYIRETLLFTIYTHYGNLIQVP